LSGWKNCILLSTLADQSHGDEEQSAQEEQSQDDSRLLSTLFASSGVHSALQHDSIMDASRPEAVLVEREASRVAKEAADALRESRRQARRNDIGTPTWTGRFGGTPRFGSTNDPGVGSESLLARMRHRQALESPSQPNSHRSSPAPGQLARVSTTPQAHVLIRQIQEFLSARGGSASSKELVAGFPDTKGEDAIAGFRKMVKQIAEFKDSVWTLKEDYT
jgi:DNA excision repair protein ERCC-6